MKYKSGKGRRPRRQQKVFKMKSGGGKFWRSGEVKFGKFGGEISKKFKPENAPGIIDKVKSILETKGFRTQNR